MEKEAKRSSFKRKIKWFLIGLVFIALFGLLGYGGLIYGGSKIVSDEQLILAETTIIETTEGNAIGKIYQEDRHYISSEHMPEHVKQAYIAIEDRRFYEHAGVDLKSVMRAVYRDLIAMSKVEGASTITQQLAKNLFLTNDKTWSRKAKEAMAALYLERHYTKDHILELYLNEIYYGHGVYGIERAAQFYFSKSARELTVAEGALLAGMAKAPNGYSPIDYPDKALERRDLVLQAMRDAQFISEETKLVEQGKVLGIQLEDTEKKQWTHSYIDLVIKEMQKQHQISVDQLRRGGYRIVVPMDETAQKITFDKFQEDDYFPGSREGVQGAFLMMDQATGKIVSAMGGRDYQLSDFNRLTAKRQPGSTFKPLSVYGPALMQTEKFTPYTLLPDFQNANQTYMVANADGIYGNYVNLYDSLVKSKNVPTVWLLDQIGISYAKSYLEKMGISLADEGLAIALGGLKDGVTPLELGAGYSAFANGGHAVKPYVISEIYNKNDDMIFAAEKSETAVFSEQVAWDMTEMLSEAVSSGTASAGEYDKALAGKTGTTEHPHVENQAKDVWFAGYTPEHVVITWMGYDHSDNEHYLTGGSAYPTKLTKAILTEIDQITPFEEKFIKPETVRELQEPIELHPVKNVEMSFEFGSLSLVRARISWDGLPDERVIYRIYEEREGIVDVRLGEVKAETEFVINHALFNQNKSYYVVAYDPLTKLESQKSASIVLEF